MSHTNRRVYYAIRAVAITADINATSFGSSDMVHGVQTATDSVNFNVTDTNELGKIDTYASMEDRPDVSLTIEKVLDGYPLVYWMATATDDVIANSAYDLGSRTVDKCKIGLAIYSDLQTTASGIPLTELIVSGAYIESLDYNLVVDGEFTESVTFSANDRTWNEPTTATDAWFSYEFAHDDAPQNANSTLLKRWNVDMSNSTFPNDIAGITAGSNPETSGMYAAHLQTIRISTNLNRTDMYELGRKIPYYRYANFPIDVTTSIEATTERGDLKDAAAESTNLTDQTINIYIADTADNHAIRFNLGTQNKLTSIENAEGGATGGVMTTTYNYTNKNTLTITGDDDPAGSSP